jgi:hypothetical protein
MSDELMGSASEAYEDIWRRINDGLTPMGERFVGGLAAVVSTDGKGGLRTTAIHTVHAEWAKAGGRAQAERDLRQAVREWLDGQDQSE